jgi:oxaloacetate decarboxylase alpha subunit
MRSVRLIDSTLCAAQLSLWGGRATGAMLLPILNRMSRIGFDAIDILDGEVYEVAACTLREHPWHRLQAAAKIAPGAPLSVWARGRCMFGDFPLADTTVTLAVRRLAACGVRRFTCYDPLNDPENLSMPVRLARDAGLHVCGAIVYAISPVHTTNFYSDRARALVRMGVDSVCLWDPAGILDPDSARNVMFALRAAIGERPLEIRAHCRSGLAEIVYLESVRAGADVLHTAAAPLAGGTSLPPAEYMVENLARDGIIVHPTGTELAAVSDYFAALADRHDFPFGAHMLRDFGALEHQLSGPTLAELENQAAKAGLSARTDEVLAEVVQIRAELGFPPMAMPIGRFVSRQALLNLSGGDRYQRLDPGIACYLSDDYGKSPAEIDDALRELAKGLRRERLSEAGADPSRTTGAASSSLTDDDLLLAAMCGIEVAEAVRAHQGENVMLAPADTPFDQLVAELGRRPWVRQVVVRKGEFTFATEAPCRSESVDAAGR